MIDFLDQFDQYCEPKVAKRCPGSFRIENPMAKQKRWVWHTSKASLRQSKCSALACAETIALVAVYWSIVLHFGPLWPLILSVFAAPLLLLRSPESDQCSLRLFKAQILQPLAGITISKKTIWCILIAATLSTIAAYSLQKFIWPRWLAEREEWGSFKSHIVIGATLTLGMAVCSSSLTIAFGAMDKVVTAMVSSVGASVFVSTVQATVNGGTVAAAGIILGSAVILSAPFPMISSYLACFVLNKSLKLKDINKFVLAIAMMCSLLNAVTQGLSFVISSMFCGIFHGFVFGLGLNIRSYSVRAIAAVAFIFEGFKNLPRNWWQNIAVVDLWFPHELLPDIERHLPNFSAAALGDMPRPEGGPLYSKPYVFAVNWIFSTIYRTSIKCTAWAWWPLAYLLRPISRVDGEAQQKQSILWPLTDLFHSRLIYFSACWALLSLSWTLNAQLLLELWPLSRFLSFPEVPNPLKVMFVIQRSSITPFHWIQWVIVLTGIWMYIVASHAQSNLVNNNWEDYWKQSSWHRILIIVLNRIRALAALTLVLATLVSLLVSENLVQSPIGISWFQK